MEENTATMQTLVIAHAAFGHNHFFKNNYLFKQWTDADGILQYLDFAKSYIAECEERYGQAAVERLLDAAHSLMSHGVHRYPRKRKPDLMSEERRERERRQHGEAMFNDLWRTVPGKEKAKLGADHDAKRRALLELPQENILYFLEKTAPRLRPWQREIIRIVRLIAQYFYPQGQTKLMNEGCATYCHYAIMNRLHETGQISDGSFLEFLTSHTNVVMQPAFDDPRYSGFNPYALGFAMMQDIERIVTKPEDEDREWFPDIAGVGDPIGVLKHVWANYRDESFVSQYLSPNLMRRWRLFQIFDEGTGGDRSQGPVDPRRARLSADPARAVAAVRYRHAGRRHPGRRRRPGGRPPPHAPAYDAERHAARRTRDPGGAAAPRRPVGLRSRPARGGRDWRNDQGACRERPDCPRRSQLRRLRRPIRDRRSASGWYTSALAHRADRIFNGSRPSNR